MTIILKKCYVIGTRKKFSSSFLENTKQEKETGVFPIIAPHEKIAPIMV